VLSSKNRQREQDLIFPERILIFMGGKRKKTLSQHIGGEGGEKVLLRLGRGKGVGKRPLIIKKVCFGKLSAGRKKKKGEQRQVAQETSCLADLLSLPGGKRSPRGSQKKGGVGPARPCPEKKTNQRIEFPERICEIGGQQKKKEELRREEVGGGGAEGA